PPRFGHMMIGEDLPVVGDEKAGAKNIQMYLRTGAGDAQEGVVVLVRHGFACAGYARIVQRQFRRPVPKTDDNMNKAYAGLVGLDNRLRDLTFGLKPLQAPLYRV